MTLHSTFPYGSKILIIFKDGSQLVTKFRDSKSGKIITDDGTFLKTDIRSTGFYKAKK
ncbi:hypothetical protein NVP2275O_296 [Vibrio phage 2.275.O._10N.286.54.E11]|nr:hypothetical protein NVP2275O_296 [Vibrio phage 2.275.O._10N.286.54.E11]